MVEQVLELAKSLTAVSGAEETVLESLCRAACAALDSRLKEGVAAADCADAYLVAAVWLALSGLEAGTASGGVKKFSAGDLTIEQDSGGSGQMEDRAWALMRPYIRDDGFVFRGVRG